MAAASANIEREPADFAIAVLAFGIFQLRFLALRMNGFLLF